MFSLFDSRFDNSMRGKSLSNFKSTKSENIQLKLEINTILLSLIVLINYNAYFN